MDVGRNIGINALAHLTTICDGTSDGNFWGGTERTVKNRKWKIVDGEGANEGAMLEFGGHIRVHVLGGDVCRTKITSRVFRIGRSQEGKIPPELEGGDEFGCIKIPLEGETPRFNGEGRTREGNPKGVHVGRTTR